jgi:hypothetical protein
MPSERRLVLDGDSSTDLRTRLLQRSPGMNVGERRARLGRRHRLATEAHAATLAEAAASMVAVHSTDPASVYVGLRARVRGADPAAIEAALYDQRSVVRMLGMRRTLFVVARNAVPIVQAACTDAIAANERRRLVQLIEDGGLVPPGKGSRWLAKLEDATVAALAEAGEATAAELAKAVPALGQQVRLGEGSKWATDVNLSSRVVLVLGAAGRIVRGRPRGSWISTQYRWSTAEAWFGAALPKVPLEEAQADLARRWLASFGPATVADLKWWAGWTVTQAKRALAGAGAVETDLGYVLPDDDQPVPAPEPWIALLGGLDSTPMGWTERGWYLGEHKAALFDRSGNIGPTVWCDGRIVGGWA